VGGETDKAERDMALDATKGAAILAVVIFHMWRGMIAAGLAPESTVHFYLDTIAYGFHTQTFLIIAGYLAFPTANRLHIQLRRQSWLYYAYLFWSMLTWGLTYALSSVVNRPADIGQLATIPYVPYLQYWFLFTLMQGTLLIGLLRSKTALLAACAVLYALADLHAFIPPTLSVSSAAIFVLIGAWLRSAGLRPAVNLPAALICLATLMFGAWRVTGWHRGLSMPEHLGYMLCGCYALFALSSLAARNRWIGAMLCLCGRQSLTIFVAHVIPGAAMRIGLAHLAPGLPGLVSFPLILAAAIGAPLLLRRVADATGTSAWLGLQPFWPDRPRPANTPTGG
jgi:surface polysaccharide O-acyltransferase-like enzyme